MKIWKWPSLKARNTLALEVMEAVVATVVAATEVEEAATEVVATVVAEAATAEVKTNIMSYFYFFSITPYLGFMQTKYLKRLFDLK